MRVVHDEMWTSSSSSTRHCQQSDAHIPVLYVESAGVREPVLMYCNVKFNVLYDRIGRSTILKSVLQDCSNKTRNMRETT